MESYATVWEAVADATPEALAAVQGDRRLLWRDFDDRASRLATALAAHGVREGTHVALFLFNSAAYAEALFACLKVRAVPVNVNFRYGPTELAALLDNADAEALVYHHALGDRVVAAVPSIPRVRTFIEVDDTVDTVRDEVGRSDNESTVPGALDYEAAIAEHAPRRASSDPDSIICSGTPAAPPGSPRACIWEQATLLTYGLAYGATLFGHDVPDTVDAIARPRRICATSTRRS